MTFQILDETEASEEAKVTLAKTKAKFGMIPNVERIMAAAPQLLASYSYMWDMYDTTTLTPVERQVVHMTSNYENECGYCIPWHTIISKQVKMDDDVIEALRSGAPLPDQKLDALRSFTRTLIANRGKASEAELQAFFDAGYSDVQAMEVILGLSMKLITNFTNSIAGTPLDTEAEGFRWKKPLIKERTQM